MPNRPASSRYRALLKFIIIGRRVVSVSQAFAALFVKPGKSGLVALGFAPSRDLQHPQPGAPGVFLLGKKFQTYVPSRALSFAPI
jgi:hypothetical protein